MAKLPSAERARAVFDYNPETGALTFRPRVGEDGDTMRWNGRCAGKKAGAIERVGYVQVRIDGLTYMAHRIAWLHFYGEEPSGQIDHIDGNKTNNAITNLRLATPSTNAANRRGLQGTKSGIKGVTYHKPRGTWQARIKKDGQRVCLGYFKTVEEAAQAYAVAAKEVFGEFARPA